MARYTIDSLVREVRLRVAKLEEEGLTPWRVELGQDWTELYGTPTEILGLPVEMVGVDGYLRVAYRESWAEPPPVRQRSTSSGTN